VNVKDASTGLSRWSPYYNRTSGGTVAEHDNRGSGEQGESGKENLPVHLVKKKESEKEGANRLENPFSNRAKKKGQKSPDIFNKKTADE